MCEEISCGFLASATADLPEVFYKRPATPLVGIEESPVPGVTTKNVRTGNAGSKSPPGFFIASVFR